MNKKVLIAIGIVVFVIGTSLAYVMLKKEPVAMPNTVSDSTDKPKEKQEQPAPVVVQPGIYSDYSADAIAATKGTKLLFFHAPWCPQCRDLDASIKASKLPDNVTIFKVDYDSNQSLRAKYGVTLQTTIVKIDDAGNKITSYVAYDEPNFQSVKQALLP